MSSFSSEYSRRRFLQQSLLGAGAAAGFQTAISTPSFAQRSGRKTDTVRLTWGYIGVTLIAKERGEFEKTLAKDGIKVEWVGPFPNQAPSIHAVVGGSADFTFGGSSTPSLAAIIAGSPIIFTQFVVYNSRTASIITNNPDIKRMEDLVGKSVAVNRSGLGEFLLIAALEKHNIDRSSVKIVYLNPPEAAPALAAKKVDAWSMWPPGVDIARQQFNAHDLFVDRELDFQIDFLCYLTTRKFEADNPDLVRAVNAAYEAEAKWMSENRQETEFINQKKAGYSDQIRDNFISLNRAPTIFPASDTKFIAEFQKAADWLTARNLITERVDVSKHLSSL